MSSWGAGPAFLLGPTKTNRGSTLTSLRLWWRGGLLLYRKGGHSPLPAHSPPCCTCRALTLPSPSHTPQAPPPHTAAPRTPPAFPPRRVPSVPAPPRCDAGSGGAERGGGARSRRGASPWAGARGSSPPGCQARLGSARLRSARLGSARHGSAQPGTARRAPRPPPAHPRAAMDGGAFGAGKAGGAFDPHAFIRQPQTLLRFVSWVRPRRHRSCRRTRAGGVSPGCGGRGAPSGEGGHGRPQPPPLYIPKIVMLYTILYYYDDILLHIYYSVFLLYLLVYAYVSTDIYMHMSVDMFPLI